MRTFGQRSAIVARRYFSAGPGKPIIVQKYGGTSLGTSEKLEKVMNIVRQWSPDNSLAMVVSAFSSDNKAEGTTSRLLAAAEAAITGTGEHYNAILDKVEDTHMSAIYGSITEDAKERDAACHKVRAELKAVRRFLESLTVIQEMSPRSHDMIIGCGERLSAIVVASVLTSNGVPARNVDLSSVFPTALNTRKVGYQRDARDMIAAAVGPIVEEGVVPVVTGFIGHVDGGIVNSIGRGYSDLTAALTAAGLGASAMQVWKESDGVFTGNPTKIDAARLLAHVTPREAAELTHFGNEVLHPFTMECAMDDNVPIHILNTFKPTGLGTVIRPDEDETAAESEARLEERGKLGITAVVQKKGISVVNLTSNRKIDSTSFLSKVFSSFAEHGVKVDLISTSETNLSLTLHESTSNRSMAALVKDLDTLGTCSLFRDRAIVSVIGEEMRSQVGVASSTMACLATAGVNLEMITQGASEINMSIVISEADADTAVAAIHKLFIEDAPRAAEQ